MFEKCPWHLNRHLNLVSSSKSNKTLREQWKLEHNLIYQHNLIILHILEEPLITFFIALNPAKHDNSLKYQLTKFIENYFNCDHIKPFEMHLITTTEF